MKSAGLLTILLVMVSSIRAGAVALRLERFEGPSPDFTETAGVVELKGPMSVRATPSAAPAVDETVLEFDYFCAGGVPSFAALPGPPFSSANARWFPALGHSEAWTSYATRIAPAGKPLPSGWTQLRFDLPLPADRVLQLRNVRLRAERPGEFDATAAKASASATEEALRSYLDRAFTSMITDVSVSKDFVRIKGTVAPSQGGVFLADIPMDLLLDDPRSWQSLVAVTPDAKGAFLIDVPRLRQRDGRDYDRLTSRWQIVCQTHGEYEALSHARFAGNVESRATAPPALRPAHKKGLAGWDPARFPNELQDLGISAVTVNLMVHSLVSLTPVPGSEPYQWQGRTYHARKDVLAAFDSKFIAAQKHGAMVSAILLVANPAKSAEPVVRLLGHPDAVKEGVFAMPNVTSSEGIALYGAILNLIAERWSRPDGKYGRVHHWIIHNEVDAGWVWTNAGEKPAIVYMDLYQRSMRLMDLIARQYDPHARSFITLTHHWADGGDKKWYGAKRLLELLLEFTRAEGDFPWALAYHPYPQNLFNPRTWEDDQATFDFNTQKITPKNLEVLDAFMKLPALLYQGKVRPVHLSENGFNSKDYSPKQLEDQAAGMALAWKKIAGLSSIESWQYHNWIDNRDEGGLRIGLRKFSDEPGDPAGPKPIWHLYQALGTAEEERVAGPYLKTIGIRSWDEILHRGPIR